MLLISAVGERAVGRTGGRASGWAGGRARGWAGARVGGRVRAGAEDEANGRRTPAPRTFHRFQITVTTPADTRREVRGNLSESTHIESRPSSLSVPRRYTSSTVHTSSNAVSAVPAAKVTATAAAVLVHLLSHTLTPSSSQDTPFSTSISSSCFYHIISPVFSFSSSPSSIFSCTCSPRFFHSFS